MTRKFNTVNYADSLQQTVTIGDCLSLDHLARFIVGVIGLLDLSNFYAGYAPIGGQAFAPEVLLGLLLYSADEQLAIYSALARPAEQWRTAFNRMRQYRRDLRHAYGIYVISRHMRC